MKSNPSKKPKKKDKSGIAVTTEKQIETIDKNEGTSNRNKMGEFVKIYG